MFRFVSGGYDCGISHALQKTECKRNTSSTTRRRCMFVATISGDVGRCTGQPGLDSSKVYRCLPDKEAGDEELSTKDTRRFELSADVIIIIGKWRKFF